MFERKKNNNSKVGIEVELFTIDNNGRITEGADRILKKINPSNNSFIKKECATNILEVVSRPFEKASNTVGNLAEYLEEIDEISKKEDISFLPLGTYPGNFKPFMRQDERYLVQQKLFGKKRWDIAGSVTGFHCHYTLPRGIFDEELRILKIITNLKIKEGFVNSYNFSIAADPAFTCFMQSSPYYQGKYIGKDSRVIMYRGGRNLKNDSGLYSKFEEFGALQNYRLTSLDIIDIISSQYEDWKTILMTVGVNLKTLSLYRSILDTAWNPVKVNANGTLEQRGMDMNHIGNIIPMSLVIKTIMKQIRIEKYTVKPSETGIKEPFKIEDDIIHIPPSSYVRKELQYLSAYHGLDDNKVYEYSKSLLKFTKKFIPKEKAKLLRPFDDMINERKTVSDEILDYTKKKGYSREERIGREMAAEIALEHSKRFEKEIKLVKKLTEIDI